MKTKKKIFSFIFGVILCLSAAGCEFPTVGVGNIPDPQYTVREFFNSLCAGNFNKADTYLDGSTVNISDSVSNQFSSNLLKYLQASYKYELVGDTEIDGLNSSQRVLFTYLDLNLLTDDLCSKTTEIGQDYITRRQEGYTTVNEGVCTLSDDGAKKVATEALDNIMQTPEKYYTQKEFTIELKYNRNAWHISLNDEIFEAIVGNYNI